MRSHAERGNESNRKRLDYTFSITFTRSHAPHENIAAKHQFLLLLFINSTTPPIPESNAKKPE